MMWVLLIGSVWAITGYPSKEACLEASRTTDLGYVTRCVPMQSTGTVVSGHR